MLIKPMIYCWAWCLMMVMEVVCAGQSDAYRTYIDQAAQATGVPAKLIEAVIRTESSFQEKAVSHKGAEGLMQLMPATATRFNVSDAFDPRQNIYGGSQYLAWLYQRYRNWSLALAAYNAGEGKVDKYGGIPPYRETQAYVQKVLNRYHELVSKSLPVTAINTGKGKVVPAVLRSASQPMSGQLNIKMRQRNLEAEARASSVFFVD